MDDGSGIELSLLEGMDEGLLERLLAAGIRSRSELGPRIATPELRQSLARELGVSARRLQILHRLNFLLPEERAERELDLERRVRDGAAESAREIRRLRRWGILSLLGVVGLAILVLLVAMSQRAAEWSKRAALETKIRELETSVAALEPIGRAYAEERVLGDLATLGPAPGWVAPKAWTARSHEQITRLLGNGASAMPPRAVSLLLWRISDLEQAPVDSLSPLDRAKGAAVLLDEFPAPDKVETVWDAAAVLLRTRLRGRALGLSPAHGESPLLRAASAWEWTSPGYVTCEELLAGLESMPVEDDALPLWSRSLLQIRDAAEVARQDRAGLPEAFARDYWLRRAELEYAVTGALLGRTHLLPYNTSSPRAFLETRRRYLAGALQNAPGAARPGLAWLSVEYEEALRLVEWLAVSGDPDALRGASCWVEALSAVEARRRPSGLAPGAAVEAALARAAAASGEPGSAWTAGRTRLEAGWRPLLMETRAGARERRGDGRSGS